MKASDEEIPSAELKVSLALPVGADIKSIERVNTP
jgi:hypothetical protein